ncbi:branched-chain amino acid ABC transporter permease [Glaciihabitans sp. GrIS 2.15]|uniref:branched-chain amino acid ABC transporter permease n=1 Tax=Glaciihabitans sp. GrIS 2.15 TaxID=3071710 RepID=UPI002E060D6F|nr:branched-chain amino acid transport system permease protein [Glaciihabitans sp. GrIS 2.15]
MNALLIYVASGITIGATYALVGSGFVVVHRVTHVVNFTQGTLAVFGGLVSYSFLSFSIPHGLAEVLAVVLTGLIGLAFGFVTIGKKGTPPLTALLITLGLSILSEGIFVTIWGQSPIAPEGLGGTTVILGASIENQRLLTAGIAVVAFILLGIFFGRTYLGKGMTAAASNPRAAALVGIDSRRMGFIAFAIAGMLGGLAGVVTAPFSPISFSSDLPLALGGFAAAVFGGLSSPWLTVVGGLVLGISGQLVAGYFGGSYQTVAALVMLLVVMIARHKSLSAEEAK